MKPTIEKIKVKFVTKVKHEMIRNMLTGAAKLQPIFTQETHIFELFPDADGVLKTSGLSFCKKSHADIGEQTKETDKRPEGIPMCAECEKAWKKDPRSPWKAWKEASGQRTD